MITKRKTIAVLIVGLGLVGGVTSGYGQDSKVRLKPVQIEGFQYRYIAKANLHMYVCKRAECGAGSKVSYIFLRKVGQPSFEVFAKNRKRIAYILRQRAPMGTMLEFAKPKVRKNRFLTVFSQLRKASKANGEVLYTMSSVIHTPVNAISLISSSPDRKMVSDNRKKFGVALAKMMRAAVGQGSSN